MSERTMVRFGGLGRESPAAHGLGRESSAAHGLGREAPAAHGLGRLVGCNAPEAGDGASGAFEITSCR